MATHSNPRSGSAARKTTAKRSTTSDSPTRSSTLAPVRDGPSSPRAQAPPRKSAAQIADAATRQFAELSGCDAEAVTGLGRDENGWQVQIEVLELRRIPNTTDLLATYEVLVDSHGELEGYRRVRRYARGEARDDT